MFLVFIRAEELLKRQSTKTPSRSSRRQPSSLKSAACFRILVPNSDDKVITTMLLTKELSKVSKILDDDPISDRARREMMGLNLQAAKRWDVFMRAWRVTVASRGCAMQILSCQTGCSEAIPSHVKPRYLSAKPNDRHEDLLKDLSFLFSLGYH
jgi:hypothetical protein